MSKKQRVRLAAFSVCLAAVVSVIINGISVLLAMWLWSPLEYILPLITLFTLSYFYPSILDKLRKAKKRRMAENKA